jgi:DNA-binding winged helix-turn-helix (wHTH) protein
MEMSLHDLVNDHPTPVHPVERPVEQAPPIWADFSVGEWLVEPSLNRLARGETVVHLRPQLMDLLVCLASGNGRTVMKPSIFDTVWGGRFVTETVLARSVTELRHALGDAAKQPTIIETIPKRGYRIIAPIVRETT